MLGADAVQLDHARPLTTDLGIGARLPDRSARDAVRGGLFVLQPEFFAVVRKLLVIHPLGVDARSRRGLRGWLCCRWCGRRWSGWTRPRGRYGLRAVIEKRAHLPAGDAHSTGWRCRWLWLHVFFCALAKTS